MHSSFRSHEVSLTGFDCFAIRRYQPEQSIAAYEMANTQDEPEPESYNEGKIDMLPQPEDRFTIKNLLFPSNTDPSPLSGFAVNICTSILGETHTHIAQRKLDG